MIYNQAEFDIKLEWGLHGVEELAPVSDVIIIVDVLSFSTCVDIAVSNSALIYPYKFKDESAVEYAKSLAAELASAKRISSDGFSLSPTSLLNIPPGTKLVLPSPNGATLSLATGDVTTLCGGIRNAKAVAEYAQNISMSIGKRIAVIPAGERWKNVGTLRPAFEDFIGAGAIISYLQTQGSLSPEAKSARDAFLAVTDLKSEIKNCSSGKELIEDGFEKDVELATELNISSTVPMLKEYKYYSA